MKVPFHFTKKKEQRMTHFPPLKVLLFFFKLARLFPISRGSMISKQNGENINAHARSRIKLDVNRVQGWHQLDITNVDLLPQICV